MKTLQHTLLLLLLITLSGACVKSKWDGVPRPVLWTPDRCTGSLSMDFNGVALTDGQYLTLPDGWLNVGAGGTHRAFQTAVMASNYRDSTSGVVQCAQATAYLALGDVDAWLVTPPLKVQTGANANTTLRYSLYSAYNGTSTFQVLCYSTGSAKNTVPPLDADAWDVVQTYTNGNDYRDNFVLEQKPLAAYLHTGDDVLYVAFRYSKRSDGSSSNTWYVDDIRYN